MFEKEGREGGWFDKTWKVKDIGGYWLCGMLVIANIGVRGAA